MITVRTIENKRERHTTISLELNGDYLNRSIRKINNPSNGSWLYPHPVDDFVTLITTNKEDPSIQTIGPDTQVTWQLDVKDSKSSHWNMAFIKLVLVDRFRRTPMKKTSWERIFKLGMDDQVSPDGTLHIGANREGQFLIHTQPKIATTYLIKYSVDFHYSVRRMPAIYYKLDPLIQIHDDD